MSETRKETLTRSKRNYQAWTFIIGLLLTVAYYVGLNTWADPSSLLVRYSCGHPVQYVEVFMLATGLSILAAKYLVLLGQRAALRASILPPWNGTALPPGEVRELLSLVSQAPYRIQQSTFGKRVRGALEFVGQRGSAEELDEHLRNQADADADAQETSFAFIRFITWAIPILGFLGTVLGITEAIAHVTPEQLSESITGVTSGLALAFDSTALALVFSMVLMFVTYLVDRGEQRVLFSINQWVEANLTHRIERSGPKEDGATPIIRRAGQAVMEAAELLVTRQADVWAKSMDALTTRTHQGAKEQQALLASALRQALEETLNTHHTTLSTFEKQIDQSHQRVIHELKLVAQGISALVTAVGATTAQQQEQTTLLNQAIDGERQVLRLQDALNQNLDTLARTGSFEQALHGLNVAIHL
jgi:hypothetical protein